MNEQADREERGRCLDGSPGTGYLLRSERRGTGPVTPPGGPAPGDWPRKASPWSCVLLAACLVHGVSAQTDSGAAVEIVDAQGNTGGAAINTSVIGPALQGSTGVVTVNQTAGDGNVQQNAAALAASEGHSVAAVAAEQARQRFIPDADQLLTADIESGAFEDAMGIYLVNQSAGTGNSQFNGAAVAVGGVSALAIVQLDDARLQEQSVGDAAPVLPEGGSASVSAGANLAPDAFEGARGLFLVNQAAGNNNATANTFTLSSPP